MIKNVYFHRSFLWKRIVSNDVLIKCIKFSIQTSFYKIWIFKYAVRIFKYVQDNQHFEIRYLLLILHSYSSSIKNCCFKTVVRIQFKSFNKSSQMTRTSWINQQIALAKQLEFKQCRIELDVVLYLDFDIILKQQERSNVSLTCKNNLIGFPRN